MVANCLERKIETFVVIVLLVISMVRGVELRDTVSDWWTEHLHRTYQCVVHCYRSDPDRRGGHRILICHRDY